MRRRVLVPYPARSCGQHCESLFRNLQRDSDRGPHINLTHDPRWVHGKAYCYASSGLVEGSCCTGHFLREQLCEQRPFRRDPSLEAETVTGCSTHLKRCDRFADSEGLDPLGMRLFYYEAEDREFDGEEWLPIEAESEYETRVRVPFEKTLEGFDIVTFCDGPNSHSPLSCNSVAVDIPTNEHCLLRTKDEAVASLTRQLFADGEPGPYRVYAVYATGWD